MGDRADPAPEAEVVVRDSVHFLCQRCVSRGVRPLDCSLRVSGSLYNLDTNTITQLLPLNRVPVKARGQTWIHSISLLFWTGCPSKIEKY